MFSRLAPLAFVLLLPGSVDVASSGSGAKLPVADSYAAPSGSRPQPPVAATGSSPQPPAAVSYTAPLLGSLRVVRGFSPPASAYGPGHRGVDLAAPAGAVVVSAGPGTVDFAGQLAGRVVVSVRHSDGLRTTYEPMATVDVVPGEAIAGGSRLGTLAAGHPGCLATGGEVCLHWGAIAGATYVDPLSLLAGDDIVLLPPVDLPARALTPSG